jgi:hypothetical protein
VAGQAVVFASEHAETREFWVGGSTVATILGNRIVPALLDRYLARTGFDSQQTDEPVGPRPDNLFVPLDTPPGADRGAHGRFDEQAHGRSWQVWTAQHGRRLVRAVTGRR